MWFSIVVFTAMGMPLVQIDDQRGPYENIQTCYTRGAEVIKEHGEYEVVKGFEAQKLGHTITAIFDPSADTETGFLSCFAEPQEAAEFLTYKRGR